MRTIFNFVSAGFVSERTSPVMNEFLTLAGAAVAIGAASGNLLMAGAGIAAIGVATHQLYTNGKALLSPAPVSVTPAGPAP